MARLTLERMQDLLQIHTEYERVNDVDGVMSTLVDDPIFEFHPQNVRIQGRAAVREMYTRLCRKILPHFFATHSQTGEANSPDQFGGRDARMIVLAADTTGKFLPDGQSRFFLELELTYTRKVAPAQRFRMFQIVTFDGELMIGERTYADADFAAVIDEALEADFSRLPGVGPATRGTQ